MKKYILLLCVMMLMLSACGKKEDSAQNVEEMTEVTEVTEDTEEDIEPEEISEEPIKLFGYFDTQSLEGEAVTEDIFSKADLTMVNIWGTYCGPCIVEMPDLGEISREYADKGFQIIGIPCDVMEPGDETALEIIDKTKADYMHLIVSDDLIENALQYVGSVPTTAFVDKDGNMVGEVIAGARSKEEWKLIIDKYLAEVE